jgi:D-3-phosphoglycerate dehydrogenase / 2-oxoglutarate reductase
MKPRIFLTHTTAMYEGFYGAGALKRLQALGEVVRNPTDSALDAAGVVAHARGCAIIVSDRQTPGPAEIFAGLPDLVAFLRCAVDIRTIDVDAASTAGVLVTQASAGFMTAVAEMGLGLMIDLSRNISRSVADYRAGREPALLIGRELKGATVGIMGYGAIGKEMAGLCRAVGMRVVMSDPRTLPAEPGITQVSQDQLLAQSDYVVCLVVATDETENLVNAVAFAKMRRHAFFINLSRGNLVDEEALAAALDARQIAGAAMDVGRAFDQMPSLTLARRPDVIATPHIAGRTPQAVAHQALETVEQVRVILQGFVPVGAVNTETAHRLQRLRPASQI